MTPLNLLALATGLLLSGAVLAQEAQIRKNLAERLPNFPKIDEISKTPIPGVYEIRIGTEVLYTDEQGNHVIQGQIIDTRTRANLTEERLEKLTAIDFSALPLKDAMVVKQGTGARKMAVFADPNCGYCKRFERDLEKVSDITVYTFLYPILSPDSTEKSRNIWCAKDRARVWQDWMLRDQAITLAPAPGCDTAAISRNVELGRKHRITGTPTLIFADGSRVPGAITTQQIEKQLSAVR